MKTPLAPHVIANLSLVALAAPALGQASFTPLGIPTGGIASFGYGVSADGSVVVGTAVDSLFNFRPWRWTAPTGTVLMPLLNGYNAGTAHGLSADGTVAVGSAVQQQLDQWQACTYTQGGLVVTGIGDLPGGDFYSSAAAISADGRVIVGTGDSDTFPSRAFRHVAGVMHDLGALPGGEWSDSYAVSADGSVIVGSSENDNFDFEAFRWTQAAGMVGLGIPSGSFESEALGVSGDGAVIVGHHLDFDGVYHAFRWTQAGGMQTLATLPGYLGGSALAANQDGSIIVGSLYDDLNRPRAMIWDATHGPRLLQQVLEDAGLSAALTGWQLAEVAAISQDGTRMVGFGSNPAFDEEAFLVHLPGGATCYANCDGSTTLPLLNVLDFVCFQTRFAAGDAYANCDGSTMPPTLNVNDFVCFQTRFVQGCP